MEKIKYPDIKESTTQNQQPCGVILGNFDGIHLGHQELIRQFIKKCKQKNLLPTLITFTPHPALFFKGEDFRFLIDPLDIRLKKMQEMGIAKIILLKFSKEMQELSAEEFIENYLLALTGLKLIYLGYDFSLGRGKLPAKELLLNALAGLEVEVLEQEPYKLNDDIVSSSKIRQFLSRDLLSAKKYLGRNFLLYGHVVRGHAIGGKYLFVTANLAVVKNQIVLGRGVYISRVLIEGCWFESITNIGESPTVKEDQKTTVETYILNFDSNIYNMDITIEFFQKIREEEKFNSTGDLKNQIILDVEKAKKHHRSKSQIHLALIGKNISHSQSQVTYEKLLGRCIRYDLIDCASEGELPSLELLLKKYNGVSITSPYKKYYADKFSKDFSFINTCAFDSGTVVTTNTDSIAITDILSEYLRGGVERVFILGDGAMSKLTQTKLYEFGVDYKIISRREGNLDRFSQLLTAHTETSLVINTCSREFKLTALPQGSFYFWDMNYDFFEHKRIFSNTEIKYTDGLQLLELQAKYALKFWNL